MWRCKFYIIKLEENFFFAEQCCVNMAEKSSGVANDAALNGDRWRAPGHCDNPSCSHRIRELEDELSR